MNASLVKERVTRRPILVGYAFGPKKMSTMGTVMTEASVTVSASIIIMIDSSKTSTKSNHCNDLNDRLQNNQTLPLLQLGKHTCDGKKKEAVAVVVSPDGPTNRSLNLETNNGANAFVASNIDAEPVTVTVTVPVTEPVTVVPLSSDQKNTSFSEIQLSQSQRKRKESRMTASTTSHTHDNNNNSSSSSTQFSNPSTDYPISTPTTSENEHTFHYNQNLITTTNPKKGNVSSALLNSSKHTKSINMHVDVPSSRCFHSETSTRSNSNSNSNSNTNNSISQNTKTTHSITTQVSFVPLDLNQPLEHQHGGKFDAILHKMTEDILYMSQRSLSIDNQGNEKRNPLLSSSLSSSSDIFITQQKQSQQGQGSDSGGIDGVDGDGMDQNAIKRVKHLCKYKLNNPSCCLVDHPKQVLALMSRSDIARILIQCLSDVTTKHGIPVSTPAYTVLSKSQFYESDNDYYNDSIHLGKIPRKNNKFRKPQPCELERFIQESDLTYPIIAKPLIAAGTVESHKMLVILGKSGLEKIRYPCILQQYANHNATLYKVYVLGDLVKVFPRPSLPNLPLHEKIGPEAYVEFDSQRPYPNLSDFGLAKDEETTSHFFPKEEVTEEEIRPIADSIRRAFGLELFGFDILITTSSTSTHSDKSNGEVEREMKVVDVNYFPSYKEFTDLPTLLAQYFARRVIKRRIDGN